MIGNSTTSLSIVKFCAEECTRQQSGEMSVFRMVDAYTQAMNEYNSFVANGFTPSWSVEAVMSWAFTIDERNSTCRQVPVTIDARAIPVVAFERILREMQYQQHEMTANEVYQEFEALHPFIDGNGRVGAILFNWMNGTLNNSPITPPEFVKR